MTTELNESQAAQTYQHIFFFSKLKYSRLHSHILAQAKTQRPTCTGTHILPLEAHSERKREKEKTNVKHRDQHNVLTFDVSITMCLCVARIARIRTETINT